MCLKRNFNYVLKPNGLSLSKLKMENIELAENVDKPYQCELSTLLVCLMAF